MAWSSAWRALGDGRAEQAGTSRRRVPVLGHAEQQDTWLARRADGHVEQTPGWLAAPRTGTWSTYLAGSPPRPRGGIGSES